MGYRSLAGGLLWTAHLLSLLAITVSGQRCAGKDPVVDPPFLLVEYGAPASAICHAQYNASLIGWEATVGAINEDDTQQLVWNVPNVTDWSLTAGASCYTNSDELQCQTHLPITIYKIPDSVTLVSPSGPLREGQQSWLQCEVQRVAPVHLLNVTWFRGATELKHSARPQFSIEGDPSQIVTVTTNLSFTASREDHGASYSCAAQLSLKTATDYNKTSNSIQLEVFYRPRVLTSSLNMSIEEGEIVELNCSFDANPSPAYYWKYNNETLANKNNNTLRIQSIRWDQGGVYTCVASNAVGEASVEIRVDVFKNYLLLITIVTLLCVLILVVILCVTHHTYHRKYKTDMYKLQKAKPGNRQNGHVAQANGQAV